MVSVFFFNLAKFLNRTDYFLSYIFILTMKKKSLCIFQFDKIVC